LEDNLVFALVHVAKAGRRAKATVVEEYDASNPIANRSLMVD
jgi:hypothetical protein